MSEQTQRRNIIIAIAIAVIAVVVAVTIGTIALKKEPDIIQGQVEVSEYRVSSKVPGRVLELRVEEGDYVKVGDTLAIIDAPDVKAKMMQAESAENAAAAMSRQRQVLT